MLGVYLLIWFAVGLITAIVFNIKFTEETLAKMWKEAGVDNFFTPKSYKMFMFAVFILLGLITPAMYLAIPKTNKN